MKKPTFKEFGIILLGGLVTKVVYRLAQRGKEPQPPPRFHPSQHFEEGEWDSVDESSWESFPASDPPSHSPTIVL
ncbi:MAG: hypothetical protein H7333_07835 [Bdellovibrionales bacterium]|nr:hypothetical protein [Oligoflexia bacterium]